MQLEGVGVGNGGGTCIEQMASAGECECVEHMEAMGAAA